MSRFRHTLWRIALSLLLGAVASIAIAMAGPRYLPHRLTTWYAGHWTSRKTSWLITRYDVPAGHDGTAAAAIARARGLSYRHTPEWHRIDDFASTYYEDGTRCVILESGFPMRSFQAWQVDFTGWVHPRPSVSDPNATLEPPRIERAGFIDLDPSPLPSSAGHSWLPYLPIWPGLIANTLIWSAAVYSLLLILASPRRALRRRRNQCPHCAYELSATPAASPCPECGRAQPSR